jgi:hypothetical protein
MSIWQVPTGHHEENNYAGHFTKWNASDCECLVFQNALQDFTLCKMH